jgi:hypothetical protein
LNEFYNKHYIRLDTKNRVIKGFSDAFEEAKDDDICINEQGGRHFEINGVINPPLTNENGVYIYKYADSTVQERTEDEIQADIDALPAIVSAQEKTDMAIAELTTIVASLLQ